MKLRLYQAFLAGFVVVLVFAGTVVGLDTILHRLFPQVLEGIAGILIFDPIEAIIVLLASLALSIGSGIWMLRQWSGKSRLSVILMSGMASMVWALALWFAFPAVSQYLLVAGSALIGGIIFAFEAVLLSTRMVYRVILSLLLIGGGAWVSLLQYNSGTQRAQLQGLKSAGYNIYIPADTSGRKVESITPANEKYDGYKDRVSINFATGGNLVEQKVDHRPATDCGSPFIKAENVFNTADSLKDFSCQLVASHNGVDVYMLERRSYASYYDDYDVDQVYFAVAGSTWIYGGNSLILHSVGDPKAQSTPEQIKALEDLKAMLLNLVPVSDFSSYLNRPY